MLASIPPTADADGNLILPPPPPDGGGWSYAAITTSGTMLVSDSATELVAAEIPGYADLPDDEAGFEAALVARYEDLLIRADMFQYALMEAAQVGKVVNIDDLDKETRSALDQDKSVPFDWLPSQDWRCPVPLILIATDYQPFTDRSIPQGNVVFLDPFTELTYLQSLCLAGGIHFFLSSGREK